MKNKNPDNYLGKSIEHGMDETVIFAVSINIMENIVMLPTGIFF